MIKSHSFPNSVWSPLKSSISVPNFVHTRSEDPFSSKLKRLSSFTAAILTISAMPCLSQPWWRVRKNDLSVSVSTGGWYAPYRFLKPKPSQQVRGEGPASIPDTMLVQSITYGVFRWYSAVAKPATSDITPPPITSTGSFLETRFLFNDTRIFSTVETSLLASFPEKTSLHSSMLYRSK